jgi:hypothetical protein
MGHRMLDGFQKEDGVEHRKKEEKLTADVSAV